MRSVEEITSLSCILEAFVILIKGSIVFRRYRIRCLLCEDEIVDLR